MKTIKIFLASSINEFADERFRLKDFVRRLNNVLVGSNIRVNMFICENADNAMNSGSKQDEYNDEIDDSDIFAMLVGEKLGIHTLGEYQYALDIKRGGQAIKIMILYKLSDETIDKTASDFKVKSVDDEADQNMFETLGELKKLLAEAIAEKLSGTAVIEITDAFVVINGIKAAKL